MAPSISFTTSIFGSQVSISGLTTAVITGEASQLAAPDIPPAVTAPLTTRTNNTSGTLTFAATGHGLVTGERVDLYWTNADLTKGHAYGAVLGTVSAAPGDLSVPIASVAGGDNLPLALVDVIVCPAVSVDLPFLYSDLKTYVAEAQSARSQFVFHDGTYNRNPLYLDPEDTDVGSTAYWHNQLTTTSPFDTFTITKVFISHADTTRTITNSKVAIVTGD